MGETERASGPRFAMSVAEAVVVFAIWSFLFAFLLRAVDAARDRDGMPSALPFLAPWYTPHPWLFVVLFPLLSTLVLTGLLVAVRALLPRRARAYLPWKPIRREPDPRKDDARLAVASAALASLATALLIFAAAHIRADRTHRGPVVTWVGPAGEYAVYLAYLGWLLSMIAVVVAMFASERRKSRWSRLGVVGVVLAWLNFLGSCLFWAVVCED